MSVAPPVETIPDYASSKPQKAFKETALSGDDNDIRVTWLMPGTVGNGKTLVGTFSESYEVVSVTTTGSPVTGFVITGPETATANQVVAAARGNPAVAAISDWNLKAGNDGSGAMVTFSELTLAGGTGTAPTSPVQTI
jgi:hypothetical protein